MGQTSENIKRTRECVINLPSVNQVEHVDRLAMTTGRNAVPEKKRDWGYRYEPSKFDIAGFTPIASVAVAPPRVKECPVQMEGIVQECAEHADCGIHHRFGGAGRRPTDIRHPQCLAGGDDGGRDTSQLPLSLMQLETFPRPRRSSGQDPRRYLFRRRLYGKGAVVDAPVGTCHVVIFGIRPLWRWEFRAASPWH
jgi:hypothetical protein